MQLCIMLSIVSSLQKVQHSAAFFAVQHNRLDMLDLLLKEHIDLSIRDIVSSDGAWCSCMYILNLYRVAIQYWTLQRRTTVRPFC